MVTQTTVPVEVKEQFLAFLDHFQVGPAGSQPVTDWGMAVIQEGGSLVVRLLTAAREYRVTAREDYLGCTAFARTDPTHPIDLSDGPLTERTWATIMQEIVTLELATPFFISNLEGSASPP